MVSRGLAWVAVLVGLGAADASAQTTLRWKFQAGETFAYALDQTTRIRMSANQQSIENSMNQVIDTTWNVKSVADGTAEIGQTFNRIRTSIETPSQKIDYDSKEGSAPHGAFAPIAPIMTALAGSEIIFKMNARGDVLEVTLPEKLLEAVRNIPAAAASSTFTEEGIKKLISQSTLALPEKPLAPGDTWERTTDVQAPQVGSLQLKHAFTFRGPDAASGGEVQRIDVQVETDIKPLEGGPALNIKEQDSRGTYLFDNAKGRLNQSTLTQKMVMVITGPNNMEITQSNETTSTMKLTAVP